MDFDTTHREYKDEVRRIEEFIGTHDVDPQLEDKDLDDLDAYIDKINDYIFDFQRLITAAEADGRNDRVEECNIAIFVLGTLMNRLRDIERRDEERKNMENGT